jgi:sialate O-acetylesterase
MRYLLFVMLTGSLGFCQLELPSLISDNMVVQQSSSVKLWGRGSGEITIKTGWSGETVKAAADENGKWQAQIKTPPAGKSCNMTIADADGSLEIQNVTTGEVWICSGQSNMQFPMLRDEHYKLHKSDSNPDIRFFTVEPDTSETPKENCGGRWQPCTPETLSTFSAVGYYFGRMLHAKTGYPIGLIDNSWGGTPAEAWTKVSVLENDERFVSILEEDKVILANQEKYQKEYDQMLEQWSRDVEEAKKLGKRPPSKPFPPFGLRPQNRAGRLYNAMLHPLMPYTIKGAVWYQGESNSGRAKQYASLFPAMINNWRDDWGQGDFPFYFVQLTNYLKNDPQTVYPFWPQVSEPGPSSWAELRESQFKTLSLPNTAMAVTIDIGMPYDIHPKNKLDVGYRLGLAALAKEYGFDDIVYSGPLYKGYNTEGDKIRISFDHTAAGLSFHADAAKGFQIAGGDQEFVWAEAEIDGDTVLVYSDKVSEPAAVRYGWSDWTYANLFNSEGLPASPFRTDDWGYTTK